MNILTQSNQSMTSQQIAELVGSRHDKVKQSIERLATANEKRGAVITLPPMGEASFKDLSGRTQHTTVYVFTGEQGKRDSIIVVAQLSPEFTAKLVDRWAELERKSKQPQIPQTYAEALQLAANQAKQLELAAPKVAHYDKVVDRHTLLTVTQVGQKIGLSAIALNRVLDELGIYNKALKRGRAFKQAFIDKGFGEMKQTDMGHSQALFSLKGEAWVIEKLASEGVA